MSSIQSIATDLGVGVGLRTVHYGHVLAHWPAVDLFEVLTDNYLDTGGRPLHVLDRVAARYPVVMHGVSLSIGSTDLLDRAYVRRVKALADRTRARMVSDHVCWTGVAGRNLHDLLPLPYDEQTLAHVVARIRIVQDLLERPLFLENPSTYLAFTHSSMPEWEFLARMCDEADCGLLIDVNNVYVSSVNCGFDPVEYLEAVPWERVGYFHMAGHTDVGTHLIDTHSDHALPGVWALHELATRLSGGRTTIYEWDADIPPFDVLLAEAMKARHGRPLTDSAPLRAEAVHG
ncbi:MAG: DUF692 domain-containing protein [Candidatus Wallbacteria bacterium]|nr:DUF692 domain-containing protein [Candidatus Wallbacteria bacterium]